MTKIILASASPRRRELLSSAGIAHEVLVADIVEIPRASESPETYAARNAFEKTLTVCSRHVPKGTNAVVLGCDTIVVKDGDILEKPKDATEAKHMLKRLSGTTHTVVSGFCLIDGKDHQQLDAQIVKSIVTFRALSDTEIDRYIATGEPFDKAGAYGAQGRGAVFVEKLDGSYTNVVGLPLCQVVESLKSFANLNLF